MSTIIDALAKVILLSIVPWMLIMVPTSAALAYRLNWRPGVGAALGLIPFPFAGWLIVWGFATRNDGSATANRSQRGVGKRFGLDSSAQSPTSRSRTIDEILDSDP